MKKNKGKMKADVIILRKSGEITDKEREDIRKMTETAAYLAEHDPQAFALAQNSIFILKARCDMEKMSQKKDEELMPV